MRRASPLLAGLALAILLAAAPAAADPPSIVENAAESASPPK
jgi:hypothetical protein